MISVKFRSHGRFKKIENYTNTEKREKNKNTASRTRSSVTWRKPHPVVGAYKYYVFTVAADGEKGRQGGRPTDFITSKRSRPNHRQ